MAKEYRQNTPYEDINNGEGDEGTEEQSSHGNTRLPFGLCKKYGIPLPDYATPRMAWEALKRGTGLTPDQIYDHLASGKELPQKLPEQAREITNLSDNEVINNNQRNSTSHMSEKARQVFDDFQARTSGKQLKHEEALAVAADGTIILEKRGAAHAVGFTYSEVEKMHGGCLIHNHPSHNSILSPADVSSISIQEKSCAMCDLDGKRMTVVYADNITIEERARFAQAYENAFIKINNEAMVVFQRSGADGRNTLYPDIKRKKRYFQDYALFQDLVKMKIKEWTENNAHNYNVEVFYDE